MGIFDWLFGKKKKSAEEKSAEHLKKEREKSIPKHRGNKFVRLQPRVVGAKKETTSKTKKTEKKSEKKKTNKPLRISWDETEDVGIVTQYKGKPFTGVCYELHENGKVKEECEMVKGLKHGKGQIFSSNGKLRQDGSHKNDKRDGIFKVYREDGTLDTEGNMINDKKEGVWKLYNDNGGIEREGNFTDNKRDGIWKKFNEDEVLEYETTYKNDIEKDKTLNPDLPPFYFPQKIIDESHNKNPLPTSPIEENKEKDEVVEEVKYEFEKNASEFENVKEVRYGLLLMNIGMGIFNYLMINSQIT